MTKANCNWWQYSRWIYNIGRTAKWHSFNEDEIIVVLDFAEKMQALRPCLASRIAVACPVTTDLSKLPHLYVGKVLQIIGRNLKVVAPTETEKEYCDILMEATGGRKDRIVTVASEDDSVNKPNEPEETPEDIPAGPTGTTQGPLVEEEEGDE